MKKFLPLLLLVVLILTGCGNTTTPEKQTEKSDTISGSFMDLLSQNKNLKCTFSLDTDDITVSGTTYVAGDKVRSESTSVIQGQEVKSYMINDGKFLYTWNDQMPGQGMKINANEMPADDDDQALEEFNDKGFNDYSVDYDYKCADWKVDQSMFKTPSNVNFTDFGELMNQFGEGLFL
jgi:hypothetical protein